MLQHKHNGNFFVVYMYMYNVYEPMELIFWDSKLNYMYMYMYMYLYMDDGVPSGHWKMSRHHFYNLEFHIFKEMKNTDHL